MMPHIKKNTTRPPLQRNVRPNNNLLHFDLFFDIFLLLYFFLTQRVPEMGHTLIWKWNNFFIFDAPCGFCFFLFTGRLMSRFLVFTGRYLAWLLPHPGLMPQPNTDTFDSIVDGIVNSADTENFDLILCSNTVLTFNTLS